MGIPLAVAIRYREDINNTIEIMNKLESAHAKYLICLVKNLKQYVSTIKTY